MIDKLVQYALMFGWSVAIPTNPLDHENVPGVIMGNRSYVLRLLEELRDTIRFDLYTPPIPSTDKGTPGGSI